MAHGSIQQLVLRQASTPQWTFPELSQLPVVPMLQHGDRTRAHRTCQIQCKASLQPRSTRANVLNGLEMPLLTSTLAKSNRDHRTTRLHRCSNSKVTSSRLFSRMETRPRRLQDIPRWHPRMTFPVYPCRPVHPRTKCRHSLPFLSRHRSK